MESKPSVTVAAGIDDNYLLPFLVMIYSAKVNSKAKFHVVLGFDSSELSNSNQELLSKILSLLDVSFDFVPVTLSKGMDAYHHVAPTSFLRLLLADKIPGLMLWLDCDLICLPGWDSIFSDPNNLPNGMVISAVRDAYITKLGSDYLDKSNNESLKIMGADYFNSGVSLIDCDKWRKLNHSQEWPKLLNERDIRGFEWGDQCILNFLCHRQVNYLPGEYNVLASVRVHDTKSKPFILHFAGSVKPWFFTKVDPRIFINDFQPSDVYRYLNYQSQLIKTVRRENLTLSLILIEEQIRIRKAFKDLSTSGLMIRRVKLLLFKMKLKKILLSCLRIYR